jgi:hypothetical protein
LPSRSLALKVNGEVVEDYDGNQEQEDCCGDCCTNANPIVSMHDAKLVLWFNIFMPGVGSLIAAYKSLDGFNCATCTCGIFQILLIPFLVGIFWSLAQGI